MKQESISHLWTGTSLTLLAGLWLASWWAPAFVNSLGMAFLAAPVVLVTVTVWRSDVRDRFTLLCLALLVLLFLIAWFV